MKIRSIALLSCVLFAATASAQPQAPIPSAAITDVVEAPNVERIRALYASASYEEALAAIPSDVNGEALIEVEQYRALCLLALGREAAAVAAIERLVKIHPTYQPSASDISPRMRTMFADVRSKLVPDFARQAYADAKKAFDAKETEAAHAGFKRTLEVIDSLPESDRDSVADLRLLASGFLDLSAARPAPEPPAPVNNIPEKRAPAGEYVPPVAVREQLPVWNPPDSRAMTTEYTGMLRILIGEDGRVRTATMVESAHPLYDAAAVRAAKTWIYKPATRGGQPVVSQKDIQVRLMPR
jgi:TonB family protein